MKSKQFYVSFIMAIVALSAVPLQQVSAKGFVFGGQPDLDIYLRKSESQAYGEFMYIPKENFDLVLDDMDRMPILVERTIFPAIREHLIKYESKIKDHYVGRIGVVYNMNEDTMDGNKMRIWVASHPEFIGATVRVKLVDIDKMSIIKHVTFSISVNANLTFYEYEEILNSIEQETIERVQILATLAEETLSKHREELLTSVIEGEGSLANKIRVQGISLKILEDMARVTVTYPKIPVGLGIIDETKTGMSDRSFSEFQTQINSIILGEPQIVRENSPLNSPLVGDELIVQSELKNMVSESMRFTYIVQVRNQDGITVSLDSVEASVASNESINAALAWTPESAGTYEIQTFVWSDSTSPPPLSVSRNISLTIMNDVMDVEHSYNNSITTYIGFPESKKRYGYCALLDPWGEACDSFIGYKEYSLTLFSEERRDIKLNVDNVPKGMWVKLVPQKLNVGPEGASTRMIIAGGSGLPFTGATREVQSLIIQSESNDEKATIGDLQVRIDIPHLTVLHSPASIELPGEIDVSAESYFRVFGAVYDPDEASNDSLSVNLSVLGLLQEGKIIPLPSWLKVDISNPSFSLNASQPYYFVIRATRTSLSSPVGDHTIVIEEMIEGQRFTQNLQIKVMEPTRL